MVKQQQRPSRLLRHEATSAAGLRVEPESLSSPDSVNERLPALLQAQSDSLERLTATSSLQLQLRDGQERLVLDTDQLHTAFHQLPLHEQPDAIAADCRLSIEPLLAAYAYVRDCTQRGAALADRPLVLHAIVDTEPSRATAARALRKACCPYELLGPEALQHSRGVSELLQRPLRAQQSLRQRAIVRSGPSTSKSAPQQGLSSARASALIKVVGAAGRWPGGICQAPSLPLQRCMVTSGGNAVSQVRLRILLFTVPS